MSGAGMIGREGSNGRASYLPSDPPSRVSAGSMWSDQIAIVAFLVLACVGALTPLAGTYRLLFPVVAGGYAAVLFFKQQPARYVSLCLWLFILTPFIRRLVDYRIGYTEGSLVLLAPYAASAISFLIVPAFLFRRPGLMQIGVPAIMIAAFYGLLLAILRGSLAPGLFDWLRWSVPPAFACYIVFYAEKRENILRELRAIALVATPLLGAYALYQFVQAPPWDTLWMVGSKMESIGQPRPYLIRVFSTLNSPGSFGFYMAALILIALADRSVTRLPSIALGLVALIISLVRTAWIALGIGFIVMMIAGSWRARITLAVVPLIAILTLPAVLTSPSMEKLISDRVESMTSLTRDKSARDRGEAYTALAKELGDNLFGSGLAIVGAFRNFGGANEQRVILDGGPIEVLRALGPIGGCVYLAGVLVSLFSALASPRVDSEDLAAALKGIALAMGTAFISSTTTIGEIGLLFWFVIGLLVAGQYRDG